MAIYWLTCLGSMILASLGIHSKSYRQKGRVIGTVIISSLPLLLLSAFRYGIGTDYFEYISIYNIYTSRGLRGTFEPLYFYLGYGLSLLRANGQWLIAICSIIYVSLIFLCIFRESPKPIFSIYLLVATTFYMSSFNTIREHVGAAILLLSLVFFERKKYLAYIILVLIAVGFHYSCIIFLLVLLFSKFRLTPKKSIIITVIILICRPLIVRLANLVLAGTFYSKYLGSVEASGAAMYLGIAFQFAILIFASIFYNKDDEKFTLYYSIQVVATWVTLFNGVLSLASRIRWIFSLPGIIFIPIVLCNIKKQGTRQILFITIAGVFYIYATVVVGIMGSYGVIPYRSIFDTIIVPLQIG